MAVSTWDIAKAVETLRTRAAELQKQSGMAFGNRRCAEYVCIAIEKGGLTLQRPASALAKDYGPSLVAAGFIKLGKVTTGFITGDVVVIDRCTGANAGHMAMFDGQDWISDFRQNGGINGIYPGPAYRNEKPNYDLYRYSTEQPVELSTIRSNWLVA
jgi:hypothetical protein